MSSNQKRSSLGWALGISLGIACSTGVVYAGSIGDSYAPGDTLTAGKMDNIKNAVNDNNGRITTNTNNITTLTGTVTTNTNNITSLTGRVTTNEASITSLTTSVTDLQTGSGTCVTNNPSDEMVRVGSICVDKYPASLWDSNAAGAVAVTAIPGPCLASGTGCTGIFAQSRATPGTALKDGNTVTWARAARACANAGKGLLTPAQWFTARSFGNTVLSGAGMFTDGNSEWVDGAKDYASALIGIGRMGPGYGGQAAGVVGYTTTDTYTDLPGATVGFRCAR